jgi:hypothetical protein
MTSGIGGALLGASVFQELGIMRTKLSFGAVALAFVAAPLSAQIVVRNDGDNRARTSTSTTIDDARARAEATRARIEAARRAEDARDRGSAARSDGRVARDIPPGHLPPRGMCRVWIDGLPPGRQPAVTDCATAERTRTANSRVIYGDSESFRGKGKGKFKRGRSSESGGTCQVWDAVVVNGRVMNVCRDDRTQRSRSGRWERDDDDRWSSGDKSSKLETKARKASKKSNKGHDD